MTKRLADSTHSDFDRRGYRRKQFERGKRMVDLFAEAISIHQEITPASAAMGISRDYGKRLFLQIRKELGPQAI
jgi:hypothetical protein